MKIGFTEFSYGYAFTENLIRSSATAPNGAPQFPNLVQEAQLGFDIKLDFPAAPLFFQFKLPELMKRDTAFEIAGGQCPGLSTPFFRFGIMRQDISKQHSRLISLEQRFPDLVYYVAPAVSTVAAFDAAYNAAEVAARSAYFSPSDIGQLPDNKQHTIAYAPDLSVAYFCSEPQELGAVSFDKLTATVAQRLSATKVADIRQVARRVNEELLSLVSRPMRRGVDEAYRRVRGRRLATATDGSPELAEVEVELLVAREIARVDLGLDFVIAQPA